MSLKVFLALGSTLDALQQHLEHKMVPGIVECLLWDNTRWTRVAHAFAGILHVLTFYNLEKLYFLHSLQFFGVGKRKVHWFGWPRWCEAVHGILPLPCVPHCLLRPLERPSKHRQDCLGDSNGTLCCPVNFAYPWTCKCWTTGRILVEFPADPARRIKGHLLLLDAQLWQIVGTSCLDGSGHPNFLLIGPRFWCFASVEQLQWLQ